MKSISELIEQLRQTEMKMIAVYSEARNQNPQGSHRVNFSLETGD